MLNEIGIERISNFLLKPADRVIVTVSPGAFQPKKLWSEYFVFSGYLRWQSGEDPALDVKSDLFCAVRKCPF